MSATQMYNIEVDFKEKGIHTVGVEGIDEDDAISACMNVLSNLQQGEYTIMNIAADSDFDIEAERAKVRLKKEMEEKFHAAGKKFQEFVEGKSTKAYLVLEDNEFVIREEDEQINGKIAAIYDPDEITKDMED